MDANEFVAAWRREKQTLLAAFSDSTSGSAASGVLDELGLSFEQRVALNGAIDLILSDTFYTLLLGLDGAASIGGMQQSFTLSAENGELVAKPGELEAAAWRHFQEASPQQIIPTDASGAAES